MCINAIESILAAAFQNAELRAFLANLAGTLIGVFVAFVLASEYDGRVRLRRDRETRSKTVSSIRGELSENLQDLKEKQSTKGAKLWVFRVSAYESAVNTGNISLLSNEMQKDLAQLYTNFQVVERAVAKVFSMLGTETAFQSWGSYQGQVETILNAGEDYLRREIPTILESLDKEIAQVLRVHRRIRWLRN